jgi:hypothetical protein
LVSLAEKKIAHFHDLGFFYLENEFRAKNKFRQSRGVAV